MKNHNNRFNALNEANYYIGAFHIVAETPPEFVSFGGKIYQFSQEINSYRPIKVTPVSMLWISDDVNLIIE